MNYSNLQITDGYCCLKKSRLTPVFGVNRSSSTESESSPNKESEKVPS